MRLPCAGAPWPSRAARTGCAPLAHYQSQAHDHSRRDARAAVHLSLTTEVYAHCTGACTFFRHHAAPERDAPGRTLHREARAAARRARRPPSTLSVTRAGLLCSLHAACTAALPVLNIQPACSALRPCRLAPDTTQTLHRTRRARGTLRARSAIRSVRCPVCLHTAQHMQEVHVHAAQSPHSDAARTPRRSPASRRARACAARSTVRTVLSSWYFLFATKRKQKRKQRERLRRASSTLERRPVRQTACTSEIIMLPKRKTKTKTKIKTKKRRRNNLLLTLYPPR